MGKGSSEKQLNAAHWKVSEEMFLEGVTVSSSAEIAKRVGTGHSHRACCCR